MGMLNWLKSKISAPSVASSGLKPVDINARAAAHNAPGPFHVGRGARMGDGSKSFGGLSGSGATIIHDHARLRKNARLAYFDSPIARAMVSRYTDVVVGTGLKLVPTPSAAILGISPKAAELWGADIAARFELWFASKEVHRARNMTGYQLQRLYETCQQRDGEVFVRCYYDAARSNQLCVEIIDPCQIYGDAYTSTSGWNWGADGIERNEAGEEIAYAVWVKRKDGSFEVIRVPAKAVNGKPFMLHGFSQEYPGQTRGYSPLSHALDEFQKLGDFSQSTLVKAANQASITAYVKPSPDSAASNIFEGMTVGNAGPVACGTDPLTDPCAVTPATGTVTCSAIPEAMITTPSMMIMNLQGGEDLKAFPNTAPGDNFKDFSEAFISYLSAASSIPVEVLLQRFDSNYSASRAALLMFWHVAQIWRREEDNDFMTPLFETWLAGEIATGRVRAPGWSDPIMHQAWLAHELVGTPVPNIDPAKLATAHKSQVELGATTLDRVAHETNGSSGASNRARLARELGELPTPPWSKNAAPKKETKPVKDEDEDKMED